jgi:hypothetical protein
MRDYRQVYIDGAWVDPQGGDTIDVISPVTERPVGQIASGTAGTSIVRSKRPGALSGHIRGRRGKGGSICWGAFLRLTQNGTGPGGRAR